jgi:hypothetical protein
MKKTTRSAVSPPGVSPFAGLVILPLAAALTLAGCLSGRPAVTDSAVTESANIESGSLDSGDAGSGGTGSAGSAPLSEEAVLQNRYLAYLREEGYSPSVDGDGDILFKIQGKSYYIMIDAKDAKYLWLSYPNFWNANTAQRRRQATMAASYASARTKVARVYLDSNNYVSASSEVFLNDPDDFRDFFPRMINTITTAVDYFEEYLEE